LNRFDGFVFLSDSEELAFNTKYGSFIKNQTTSLICHNGVDTEDNSSGDFTNRGIDFIVVGRIEELKNSVEVLKFRNQYFSDKSIVFIGANNPYHKEYSKKFEQLVLKSKALHIKSLPHDKVLSYLKQARVLLNFSLLECSPLVDLEALSQGCKVITTSHSYTHLKSSSDVLVLEPDHVSLFIPQIKEMVNTSNLNKSYQYKNWKTSLEPLLEVIRQAW